MSDRQRQHREGIVDAAILHGADSPELLDELANMAVEVPDEPDEDDGPVDESASKRVDDWIRRETDRRLDVRRNPAGPG
jgi:hypothetical protein